MSFTGAKAFALQIPPAGGWIATVLLVDENTQSSLGLVLDPPKPYDSESAAAKAALETINGLGLKYIPGDKIPVFSKGDPKPINEEISQEFLDHLIKLKFDSGRIRLHDNEKNHRVRVYGAFYDHKNNAGIPWKFAPEKGKPALTIQLAIKAGLRMLRELGLSDDDRGHHILHHGPGGKLSAMVDDEGRRVSAQ